ncbi:right-handed parallel beta-helix repeat-containing protein [Halobacillus sp. A1]|uniref:right-handed parallel beta-helix repeat-containing protein n=1 Tax=Halobacillus sp. A1 TaxID=2880262 RepID=UPI0020A6243C|nr:NosD domain-containing protein [Halobacillus sp. A1]MCP3033340.1 right-handed parallel beta-helix repeat-containing protein [Halobacillus sp. A1]
MNIPMKTTIPKLLSMTYFLLIFVCFFNLNSVQASGEGFIQKEINQAAPGEKVTIPSGTYEETVVIDKPITLEGNNVDWISEAGETLVTIEADNVTIQGIKFKQGDQTLEQEMIPGEEFSPNEPKPTIRVTSSSSFTFQDNYVDTIGSGIFGENNHNFTVENNKFTGVYSSFIDQGLAAVELYETDEVYIEENLVENVLDGFYLDSLSHANIINNTVKNSRYATHLMYSSSILGDSNRFQDNVNGLMIMDTTDAVFSENTLVDQFHVNGYGVLMYRSKGIELFDNEISRNITGIKLEEAERVKIHDNIVAGNQKGIAWERQREDFEFHNNIMVSNVLSTQGDDNDEAITLYSGKKGNYWDDYNLVDKDGDRIGEKPYLAGSIYDSLLSAKPEWQLFMNSPAMTIWSQVTEWLPPPQDAQVMDAYPQTDYSIKQSNSTFSSAGYGWMGLILLMTAGTSVFYFRKEK